jgi:hypothetical protein
MSLTGGKRKVNKSLKAWVAFVKKVQKEEKLSYKDAIHRAKVRKDKGEKWMKGGADGIHEAASDDEYNITRPGEPMTTTPESNIGVIADAEGQQGGRRRRRSMRRRRSARRGRTMRRRRASRRH